MKTYLNRYKKYILAALLAGAAGLFLAASNDAQPAFKIEGAWLGQTDNGVRGLITFTSNLSGKGGTFRNQMVWPPEVLTELGLQSVTDEIGEYVMTGKDTSTYTARWYGLSGGGTVLVFVDNGSMITISPTELRMVHEVTPYTPDVNGQPGPPSYGTNTVNSISRRITH